ncbi:MAG: ABC transporter substrate-binding protein [Lachnospiraceae bacterium]|nr:ABC transporter substrate-binding protein [Lachnospiraceae bacterium]
MKWSIKKTICVLLTGIMTLSGCATGQEISTDTCPYEEFIVVDVFDNQANYQGIQSGWFGKLVKDKFNMELNIIAPNVAGGGDTLLETRSAAGDLGDLIFFNGDDVTLQDMVTAGLLMDMETYIKDKDIMRFETAIRKVNNELIPAGIYALPSGLSKKAPTEPAETIEPTYGPYIRWDLYKQLGYPKMETLEDILPILKQMQQLEPKTADGDKTYGFSFFKDWDGNLMNAIKQPCCFYGYDESGFVLVKADGTEYQSIMDANSLYVRMLKFFFKANQLGLVDPESLTQSYTEYVAKYADGQIFFSPWPWAAQPEYNTVSNKEQGKGYMMADIEDMCIYTYGSSPEGNSESIVAIGAGAKDPQRMADFIDWLYSSEGVFANGAGSMSGTAGPEGLCWEAGENGPVITEFGMKALFETDVEVPEQYGSGSWKDGISELNFKPIMLGECDERGYPYMFQHWDSVRQMQETELDKDWREVMGANTTMEYLMQNGKLLVAPGGSYTANSENTELTAIRKQCRSVIQKYSWEMVFAENESEFYELLLQMQKEVKGLGYDTILAFDMENAKQIERQRKEYVAEYENKNKGN